MFGFSRGHVLSIQHSGVAKPLMPRKKINSLAAPLYIIPKVTDHKHEKDVM
jgi:hypothetical protein